MRDALLAALTLDTFHRHADKVAMANVAQLINCLQSLFLVTHQLPPASVTRLTVQLA